MNKYINEFRPSGHYNDVVRNSKKLLNYSAQIAMGLGNKSEGSTTVSDLIAASNIRPTCERRNDKKYELCQVDVTCERDFIDVQKKIVVFTLFYSNPPSLIALRQGLRNDRGLRPTDAWMIDYHRVWEWER